MTIIDTLHHLFISFVKEYAHVEEIPTHTFTLNVEQGKSSFGDISTNIAMVLAPRIKKIPRDFAREITNLFAHEAIASMEVAGPGFINITLTTAAWAAIANDLSMSGDAFFKLEPDTKRLNVNLEFVSANPTGPLHIGHGRGAIIGDVLAHVMNFIGHKAHKEFYINDAGSQIQKLGASFKTRCFKELGKEIAFPEDGYQGEYLIALAKECVQEYGDTLLLKDDLFFSEYAKKAMLEQQKETLQKYGVTFNEWFSEKKLHESGAIEAQLDALTIRGYTYKKEHALWFRSTDFGDDKDRVLRKSDGELTYVAADAAYLQNKVDRGFDRLIMVLGQDHHGYVVRLKGLLQASGYDPAMLDIILYQLVSIKEGGEQVRLSKRAGRIVDLAEIIDTVGTDVARFFYLQRKADAHLEFDLDLALKKTEENPVYYIQYAYVRINSILIKAAEQQLKPVLDAAYLREEERALLRKIVGMKHLLITISNTYQTHLLAHYAIELAQQFHHYYAHSRVIDMENQAQSNSRLFVLKILYQTLERSLRLLGLSRPEKM